MITIRTQLSSASAWTLQIANAGIEKGKTRCLSEINLKIA